jgi:hypothetical protein
MGGIIGVVGGYNGDGYDDLVVDLVSELALEGVRADWLTTQSLVELSVSRVCRGTFCVSIAGGGPDPRASFLLWDAGT